MVAVVLLPTNMALTPEQEARYQELRTELGLNRPAPVESPDSYGTGGFAARTLANILPGAVEKVVQPFQMLMGAPTNELSHIPNFFDMRAPASIPEHIIGGAGEIAEYLPAMIGTEAMALSGLTRLGMAAPRAAEAGAALMPTRAARLTAAGIGAAVPTSPHGAETASIMGGVAGMQRAAMDWGWRGKIAAGLIGGGLGYYEGAKGPHGTPTQGAIFGALNLLGPTVIDPVVGKLTGYKPYPRDAEQIPGQPHVPPPVRETLPGAAGVMDEAFQAMNPAQRQAYLDALAGRSEPSIPTGYAPGFQVNPQRGMFHGGRLETDGPTSGGINWTSEAGLPVSAGMDLPNIYGSGNEFDIFAGLQKRPMTDIFSPGERAVPLMREGLRTSPPNAFRPGPMAPPPPPRRPLHAVRSPYSEAWADVSRAQRTGGYGGETGLYDIFHGLETAPTGRPLTPMEQAALTRFSVGDRPNISTLFPRIEPEVATGGLFTPREAAIKAQIEAARAPAPPPPPPKAKAKKAKVEARAAEAPPVPKQTITEKPASQALMNIRPVIDIKGNRKFGAPGDTHQDIFNKWKQGKSEDEIAEALIDFDSPENPNYFIDKAGNAISRNQLEKTYGIRDSQGLWAAQQRGTLPKTEVNVTLKDEGGHTLKVVATKGGEEIGTATLYKDPKTGQWMGGGISVKPAHQRQGIATKMYDAVEEQYQHKILPSTYQTKEAKAFWEQRRTRGTPPKTEPVEPAAPPAPDARPQVMVFSQTKGWEQATVIGSEGNTLHVQVEDPIFGARTTSVLKEDTRPVAGLQKPIEGGGVPFKDVESARLTTEERLRELEGERALGSMMDDDLPASHKQTSIWADPHGNILESRDNHAYQAIKALGKPEDFLLKDKGMDILMSEMQKKGYSRIHRDRTNNILYVENLRSSEQRKLADKIAAHYGLSIIDSKTGKTISDYSLGSMMEGSGPAGVKKTLKGKDRIDRTVLSIQEGLARLPDEPRALISEILHQAKVAVGRDLDIHFERHMQGAKGAMYVESGRIGVNLHWINGIVQNWAKMTPDVQAKALMRATGLFGHEITHVVHRYAEKSGLAINGVPVTEAIVTQVESMAPAARKYVAEQLIKAKGEGNVSERVLNYLSGDYDQVYQWYSKRRPNLTPEEARKLAAGEVMAEIGSTELVKRMNVSGLPQAFRDIVDRFKQVLINVVKWFTGHGQNSEIAALQNLQSIASKMYDHFAAADQRGLAAAFPHSATWKTPPVVNPFSSGAPPPGSPGSTVPQAPAVEVLNGPLLKQEMLRLGIRGAVGGALGGYVGPALAPNQISTAEGVILGGIAGIFGPAIAKKLLSENFAKEVAAARQLYPKSPIKALQHIMGGGKTFKELGIEGRFGWTGQGSAMSKLVRWFERDFNWHKDPKQRAIEEDARGLGSEVMGLVHDALNKTRWYKPNAAMVEAAGHYLEGRISKTDFEALLTSPELQTYGNFIVTAREGISTLSQMYAEGLPNGAFKTHIMESLDKYLGKFYSAYTEGKFNMEHFAAAKADMMRELKYSDEVADALMHEYMREVQANRKIYSTGRRGESGEKYDTGTMMRRMATEEEIEAQMVVVGGLEHDPHGAAYLKEKAKLDWMQAHKITDNWRLWLGEYTNPIERMIYTFQKIHPSAISGKTFSLLDSRVHSNGLKFAYTPKELATTRANLESELASGKLKPEDVALYQDRLRELNGYGPLPEGAAYGRLSGKWVDRFTRDGINTYDTPYQWMEQPVIRALAEFNNVIKIGRTALTPLTVWRNYLSMGFMGLIARTNWADVAGAFKEIHFTKGADYRLMLQKHIIGSDFSTVELARGPGTIFSGYLDADIATKAGKEFYRLALKNYQQPDMLVRAGAFQSARKRFAQELMEKGYTEADGSFFRPANLDDARLHHSVIDKAVEFTERYTMNYATVPNIVKIGRQLPFVNMFISYTAEITRILKNLTEDVIAPGPNSAGRMHAIMTLGAMAAIPMAMTAWGKSNLSKKDREDWNKLEALSPYYNRSRFRIPYKRDEQGRFHYYDITNLLPADNYSQMIKAFAQGDKEAFLGANPLVSLQNTPLLNMATEQITGEDIRTGESVKGFGRVRELLKEVLPPIIPPGYEGQRLIRAFSSNVEGEMGLTNIKTGVQYRPSDIVANYMTGMRFGNAMLSTVQRQAISQAKQQIAEQQQLLRDTTNMNVGPEQKARATEIYNKAVEQIMLQLHSRMPDVQE